MMWRFWAGLGIALLALWIVVELLYVTRSPWVFNDTMFGDALQAHLVRKLLGLLGGGLLAIGLWERHDSTSENATMDSK